MLAKPNDFTLFSAAIFIDETEVIPHTFRFILKFLPVSLRSVLAVPCCSAAPRRRAAGSSPFHILKVSVPGTPGNLSTCIG